MRDWLGDPVVYNAGVEKLFTKIVGTPIYEDGARPLTSVKDVVIDPENGRLIAFVVSLGGRLVVSPMDIVSWHDVLKVDHDDVIVQWDEILRVGEVMKSHVHVFRARVETEEGKYLGKVNDFSIKTDEMRLAKLYISKGFWGLLRYDSRIIPYKNIVEILPDKIVVKDDAAVVKVEKENVRLEEAVG